MLDDIIKNLKGKVIDAKTVFELLDAFHDAREDRSIGVILLSGEGPSPKDGGWAFCSGGDQRARGKRGYEGGDGIGRLKYCRLS